VPIRNTQPDSRHPASHLFRRTSPELPWHLYDFNAHHPAWNSHISPDSAGNSLFNWISSSQRPRHSQQPGQSDMHSCTMHTLLQYFITPLALAPLQRCLVGSCSSSLTCEWRTFSGLDRYRWFILFTIHSSRDKIWVYEDWEEVANRPFRPLGSDHLLMDIALPIHHSTYAPAFNFKKHTGDEFQNSSPNILPLLSLKHRIFIERPAPPPFSWIWQSLNQIWHYVQRWAALVRTRFCVINAMQQSGSLVMARILIHVQMNFRILI